MAPDDERARLLDLIEEHHGSIAAIAKALTAEGRKITRQGVSLRIHRHGLTSDADAARALAGIGGQRSTLPGQVLDQDGERAMLLAELARGPDRAAVAERLGMSRRNMYRKMLKHGINDRKIRGAARG